MSNQPPGYGQPGPDQPPAQYPQQPQPGQYAQQPQPGQYAQPGQYPQQGQYPPQGQYPQQPQYAQPYGSAGYPPVGQPRKGMRGRLILVGIVTILLIGLPIAGLVAAGIVFGTGDKHDKMVPADTDVYLALYLDPALDQKRNLQTLMSKFPDAKTDQQAIDRQNKAMNDAFKASGLSFEKDVRPWLGSQASAAFRVNDKTPGVVIVASKDDKAAQAALDKLRTGAEGSKRTWTQATHGGITEWIGTAKPDPQSGGSASDIVAFAYVDHNAVIAPAAANIDAVIDTDQGRRPSLHDNADYKAFLAKFPGGHLALAYVSGPGIVSKLQDEAAKNGTPDASTKKALAQLAGLKNGGAVVTARPDGIATNLDVALDASKFDADTRAALSAAKHQNTVLKWVPKDVYGFFVQTSLKASVQQLVTTFGQSADTKKMLDDLGLTAPGGFVSHLGQDFGIEVRPANAKNPAGALMFTSDDAKVTGQFLDKVTQAAGPALAPPPDPFDLSGAPPAAPQWQTETYKGATLRYLRVPSLQDNGLVPAYAVVPGTPNMAIVASTLEELKAVIDAHTGGTDVTTADTYKAATGGVPADTATVFYVDIDSTRAALEKLIPKDQRTEYDKYAADLAELRAFVVTGQSDENHFSEQVLLLVH
jgi:hypothetical protein